MLLPSFSTNGHKSLQSLHLRKRRRFLTISCILLLLFSLQIFIFATYFRDIPANVSDVRGATMQDTQRLGMRKEPIRFGVDGKGQQPSKEVTPTIYTTEDGVAMVNDGNINDRLAGKENMAHNEEPDGMQTAVIFAEQEARRLAVRQAMIFAWENYEEHAFGEDEVYPKNGTKRSHVWGDIACTLVDGIDTLWIMDLKDEYRRARDYVATRLDFSHLGRDGNKLSVFETIIREVGGLLGAFDLSGDTIFKHKAKELMDLLTPAYDEKEGVFYTYFNPYTKEKSFASWAKSRAHIADIGTLQLEMRYLSDITGDPKYADMGNAFYQILKREGSYKETGLFPVHLDPTLGKFDVQASAVTLGAFGDSFYEYLLKVYIYHGNREEDKYLRDLYDDAVKGIEQHLLYFSDSDDLYFLQELIVPSFSAHRRMDHLVCFVPGMLALGTLSEVDDHAKNARHLELAEKLMKTCYQLYHHQPTGLSPDIVRFPKMKVVDPMHRLRPETVESLFYMYRVTKNSKYREFGWEIFQALEAHAKVDHGYAAVLNVTEMPARTEDKMESFFLAETLKYHYLLQAPESLIPLDKYVFNTEAHPLSINRKN